MTVAVAVDSSLFPFLSSIDHGRRDCPVEAPAFPTAAMPADTLSLFPRETSHKHSPVHMATFRTTMGSPASEHGIELVKMSGNTRDVVIAIQETPGEAAPSALPTSRSQTPQPSPSEAQQHHILPAPPPRAHLQKNQRTSTPPPRNSTTHPRSRSVPQLHIETKTRPRGPTPTLVRPATASATPLSSPTPVMQSMFPKYDPSMPLAQQHYYPDLQGNPRLAQIGRAVTAPTYTPSNYSPRQSLVPAYPIPQIEASSSSNTRATAFPLEVTRVWECVTELSTPKDLLGLWSIANGQNPNEGVDDFTLELNV